MSKLNNSRPSSSRNPRRRMVRSQGDASLWRLSGRYSSYRASTHRGWIWTRPQHFPQPDETEQPSSLSEKR